MTVAVCLLIVGLGFVLAEVFFPSLGVFGLIHVAEGRLEYTVYEPLPSQRIVTVSEAAVVVPEVEHCVRPLGAIRFHVEFWRRVRSS